MKTQELLYLRFRGRTASFRIPTTITGAQLSLEVPSYSTIIGLLSIMLGRKYDPANHGIGIRYTYDAQNLDLETTHRWQRDAKSGGISYNGTNPRKRQVHYNPLLEVFLTDTSIEKNIRYPKRTPTLGRSQDIAKLEVVKTINAIPVKKGRVSSTLIPIQFTNENKTMNESNNILLQNTITQGILYVLPIDFDVSEYAKIRLPKDFTMFLSLPFEGQEITMNDTTGKNQLLKFQRNDVNPDPRYPWDEEEQVIYVLYP